MGAKVKPLTVARIREALADYMHAEGCSCCRDADGHRAAAARLANLLRVPRYKDGSGYDFPRFRSKKRDASRG